MHHVFGDVAIPPATFRPLPKDLPKLPPKKARVDKSDDEEGKEDDAYLAEVATMFSGHDQHQQGAGVGGGSFLVEIILIMWSLWSRL